MQRNNKAVIYTSSYDRGLEHLLKMWPDVKKSVPDAELHIFYGWQLFDQFYRNNPERMAWRKRMTDMMAYDGITEHGRLPQPELAEWYKKCGVWAYSAHFGEISCISAMKAQVYGAVPCVVSYAALEETVQHGIKVEGDIYDKETFDTYKESLIGLLNNDEVQEEFRKPMMKWAAEHFSWESVATQWSKEFNDTDKT